MGALAAGEGERGGCPLPLNRHLNEIDLHASIRATLTNSRYKRVYKCLHLRRLPKPNSSLWHLV